MKWIVFAGFMLFGLGSIYCEFIVSLGVMIIVVGNEI